MNRTELLFVHVANGLVAATGLVYAAMRYFMTPVDEFSVVNHPWQPHVQHLHVLSAPLLVFAVGLIWSRHVLLRLRNGDNGRVSGLGLLVGFVPMALSGYLVQVAVQPSWRAMWIVVHVASSMLWLVAFTLHQVRTWTVRKRENSEVTESVIE